MLEQMLNSPGGRDLLTGLAGPVEARAWLDEAGRLGAVQAMMISLQRLQSVNIAYGMAAGDHVLVEIARRIDDFAVSELGQVAPGTRTRTMVARIAGGEFLLASSELLSRERWQYLAEALVRVVARPMLVDGETLSIAARAALLRAMRGEPGSVLLDRLDQALLVLQRTAGRRVLWSDDCNPTLGRSAAALEGDLLGASHRDEIAVLFQPQFDVATGALAGAEALARWEHPKFGRISAETLFAIADRGDHVAQLSRHIGARALEMAAHWPKPLRLSLNITAEDFALGDCGQVFRQLIEQSGFPPERLTLEITEQTLIGDFEVCATALGELATMGVQVALDDFGTGFSNFRALKALPLDALKLDRSLVRDIDTDPRDRAILSAMLAMARALGLKVIAEGVENEEQLAILATEGCDLFQGFLRAGPLSLAEFEALIPR